MKWFHAENELPANREEVLIRHNDHYYLADYSEEENRFILRAGGHLAVTGIRWLRIEAPLR